MDQWTSEKESCSFGVPEVGTPEAVINRPNPATQTRRTYGRNEKATTRRGVSRKPMTAIKRWAFGAGGTDRSNRRRRSHLGGGLVPSDYCPKFDGIELGTPKATESQKTTERLTWQTIWPL